MDFRTRMKYMQAFYAAAYDDSDGPVVEFPRDLSIINPKFKATEKSYHDLMSLCLKLQRLVNVSREYIVKEPEVVESNPEIVERKLDNLMDDAKKIESIARAKAMKALEEVIGNFHDTILKKIVEKMLLCDPMSDMWKVENNSAKVKKEIEEVYMKLAGVYKLICKLCSCISVNCQLCGVVDKLEWDEEGWKGFIEANKALIEVKDENGGKK